jgi:hypothetical protein
MRFAMHKEHHMHQGVRLTPRELLSITDIGAEGLKSMRRRDNIAIAFGGDDVVASKMYTPIDAVALLLSSTLARTYGAGTAASLVRAFANVLLVVVAEAEASTVETPISVVEFRDDDDRRAFLVCGGDAMGELAKSPATQGYRLEAITTVNISGIIAKVRTSAARLGLNLGAAFVPPADSVAFAEMMQSYDWGVFVEEKALKKRDRAARKIGVEVRALAMGGRVVSESRKAPLAA